MSAFVVIALAADGAIQLFAPAQFASMLQENWVRHGPDPCRGSDHTRLRHPLRHSSHSRPRRYPGDGLSGGAICAHVRIGELGSPPEIISLALGAMTWGGLYARDPRIRAVLPLIR